VTGRFELGRMDAAAKALQSAVTKKLPRYLQNLPVPRTAAGWANLGRREWAVLAFPLALVISVIFFTINGLFPAAPKKGSIGINPGIHPEREKVVNNVSVNDIEDTATKAYCRCWKSKKFPFCDGAHNKHNRECGDNVGPLIIKGKNA